MNKQDRLSKILELAIERSSLEVEEVAHLLDVSPATVRRDFDALAKRQLLSRTHGGAVASGGSIALPLNYKVARGDEAKERIAQAAAELVPRYAIIGINGGTTSTAVARAIVARSEFSPAEQPDSQPALTVVTNAVNIAAELTVRHQIKIVVTGGVARPQSYELTGPFAEEVLKEVNIDIAFIGVDAIDAETGASADQTGFCLYALTAPNYALAFYQNQSRDRCTAGWLQYLQLLQRQCALRERRSPLPPHRHNAALAAWSADHPACA